MLDKIRLKLEKIPSEYRRWSAFGILLALLLALPITIWGLTSGRFEVRERAVTSEITPTPTPVLNFPADHGSHPSFNTEWWYLNLLTRTTKADGTDQRDLAYVVSFSRILGSNNLLSSRYDNTSKSFKESTEQAGSLVVQLMDGSRLFVQFSKGLVLTTLEELATGSDRKKVYHLTGRTANMGSFDLTLKERTVVSSGFNTPLLWGGTTGNCQGKISVFAQDDTYYYSVPDLDITGFITDLDGTRRNVLIGKAWIDHQWFNSSPPSDWRGHYWTNFHFTNSSDLYSPGPHQAFGFVTQIYSSGSRYTYWVKRNANGTNECGTNGTVVVKSYGSTNYPNSWTVNNGSLDANGYSFSDNQIFQPPIGPKFIEAASYYSGNLNGIPFTGLGFFETHLIRPSVTPIPTPTPTPLPRPRCELPSIKPPTGPAPLTVTLFGGGSAGYTPGIDGYQWDFENDGIWDTGISLEPVTHTYTRAGTYYPRYRVHSVNGQWSDICNYPFPIIVTKPPCSVEGEPCGWGIYGQPLGECCPELRCKTLPDGGMCISPITPTPTPSYQMLRFKLKFAGVTSRPIDDSEKQVKLYATSLDGGPPFASSSQKQTVWVAVDDSGIYHGYFNPLTQSFGHHYRLRIKGPKHLQEVFSDVVFDQNAELDLTGKPLRPGDVNGDGILNITDLQEVDKRIFSTDPSDIAFADVNFDKRVDIIDRTLILNTLSVQYDQE